MISFYDHEHTITFIPVSSGVQGTGKNTWTDWRLVPARRPHVAFPSVKTEYMDTSSSYLGMGVGGSYDSSNATKYTFQDRSGEWEFYTDSDYYRENDTTWADHISEIANYLQGVPVYVVLSDDSAWYYQGLVTVQYDPNKDESKVTFTYVLDPYKYSIFDDSSSQEDSTYAFGERWRWDPFDFDNSTILEDSFSGVGLAVDSDDDSYHFAMKSFTIPVSNGITIPIITITINSYTGDNCAIEIAKGVYSGETPNWPATSSIVLHPSDFGELIASPKSFIYKNFIMKPNDNILTFWVWGTIDISISISFREGKL